MVLGNVADRPVCYHCGKPGHIRKNCFKLRNSSEGGRGAGNYRGNGRGNGRNGGRQGSSLNNMSIPQGVDMQEVMRLGMAAALNKEKQQQ